MSACSECFATAGPDAIRIHVFIVSKRPDPALTVTIKESTMHDKLILREINLAYEIPARFLCDQAGYELLTLLKQTETPIQSKRAWLKQGIRSVFHLFSHLGRIRKAKQLILIGNYMSLFAVFLNKTHIIHPDHLYWWGFQIRGERMQKLLKNVFRVLYAHNLSFIIFSQYEKKHYTDKLNLPEDSFIPIPYGDWKNLPADPVSPPLQYKDSYFFTGGYSNRDYAGLLRAWNGIQKDLVIIGSKNNSDLYAGSLHNDNPYVKILLDTPPEVFSHYLNGAKACILPFITNTGASGQTVALQCMKAGILIISSTIDAMTEYIKDKETGFLINDLQSDLPSVIQWVESNPKAVQQMIQDQTNLFKERFSYDVITKELLKHFS